MDAINGELRTKMFGSAVSRRAALRGLGGAGLAALAIGVPTRAGASDGDRIANALFAPVSSDDPATVIEDYLAAVNAGDLEGILALYDEKAVHIALPTPDGSAGVCLGKDQFRMWYEQSVANADRVAVEEGTLAVDGNQAAYVARIASDPWRTLGLETLEANAEMVVIDGRIMTHVVVLTPESVRKLQVARETTSDQMMGSNATLLSLPQSGGSWAAPSVRGMPGKPY